MTREIRWIGPKDLKQQALRWVFSSEEESLVVPFAGPLSVCLAKRPKAGQAMAGFATGGMRVQRVEIEEGDGESGTMTVYLSAPKDADEEVSADPLGVPIYELEWEELTKPIEQHPDCGTLNPERVNKEETGAKASWDDWPILEQVSVGKPNADYIQGAGDWSLAQYRSLREKGVDSYNISFPVVRETLYLFRTPPNVGVGCYGLQVPPPTSSAPGAVGLKPLVYMKTKQSLRKEGRLRVVTTEWTGAFEWSALLY